VLPFSKLIVGTGIISDEQDITEELFKYFSDLAKAPEIDPSNPHDIQVEMEYPELQSLLAVSTEVTKFVKKMKAKKSLGHDQISNLIQTWNQ
jgi:hypothetical protein